MGVISQTKCRLWGAEWQEVTVGTGAWGLRQVWEQQRRPLLTSPRPGPFLPHPSPSDPYGGKVSVALGGRASGRWVSWGT